MVVVLNEHSGFGSSNAAPTAAALVRKWLELKEEDARAREGVAAPRRRAARRRPRRPRRPRRARPRSRPAPGWRRPPGGRRGA